ncbi:MAG: hypothetical protein ACTSQC_09580, partial [Candidatus Heimdallarchaeaceae archaeon]
EHDLLARYVFEKDDNVRKFLAWKTYRDKRNTFFFYYVIFKTDYSSSRKKPLDRKARVTNDEKQMWHLFDQWLLEEMLNNKKSGLKKGWILYNDMDSRDDPVDIPLE